MPNNNQQQAVYLQSGAPATENRAPDEYSGGQIGSRFTLQVESGGNPSTNDAQEWQLVQNDSVMDVAPSLGAVAYWRDRARFLVTTDAETANRGNVAGVYGGASDVGNITAIQKKGPASVQLGSGSPSAAGLFVIGGTVDGKADVIAAAGPLTYPALGKSVGTVSGGLFPAILNVDDGVV